MRKTGWIRAASFPIVAAALVSPAFVQCGGGLGNASELPVAPKCPQTSDPDAVLAYDWAGRYKIDAASANKIKAGVAAAMELQRVAARVDADLKTGCGGLAADLGAPADFKTGKEACDAAVKAIHDARAKLGRATISLDVKGPKCGASMAVMTDCAAKCDATVKPGAKVDCEPGKLQGTCNGGCTGSCDVQGGAKCEGTCAGRCDGKCNGKCEGTPSSGLCAGNCEGACSGSCTGTCELKAKAPCSGTCTGSCDVEMNAPRCAGELAPPPMSAECRAHCNAKAQAKFECTPARVGATVKGGDKALAAKLKTALEKDLPMVLQVSMGMADRLKKVAEDTKVVIEGVQGVVKTAASGPTGAALAACIAAPFSAAAEAAGSLDAGVTVSVSVSASVSAH